MRLERGGSATKRVRKFLFAMPTSGHAGVRTEYLEATLGLAKRLEISKELIRVQLHATAV